MARVASLDRVDPDSGLVYYPPPPPPRRRRGLGGTAGRPGRRLARTGILVGLAALAGGAAAYAVWQYAKRDLETRLGGDAQALRRELLRGGENIQDIAQTAARAAAERQVWATLGSFGLSQDRIRAIQQFVLRAESAAGAVGLRGGPLGDKPAAAPAAKKKGNGSGNGFPDGDGGDDGGAGYLN